MIADWAEHMRILMDAFICLILRRDRNRSASFEEKTLESENL